jgi:hypothetical protein
MKRKQRTYEDIIKIFEKQEGKDRFFELDKRLFKASQDLSLDDWREIRKDDFWTIMDNIQVSVEDMEKCANLNRFIVEQMHKNREWLYWKTLEIKKKSFTLRKVYQYIKNNK